MWKKIMGALLAAAVLFASACGNIKINVTQDETGYEINIGGETEVEIVSDQDVREIIDEVVGGWTVNHEFTDAALTDEEKEIFEKAMEGIVGAEYVPVAVIAKQLVAGMNYMYLCGETIVYKEPSYKLACISIYKDLSGNVSLNGISNIDIAAFTEEAEEEAAAEIVGGWSVNQDLEEGELPEDAKKAFDAAMETITGMGFTPVALLGTQVVAGTNYAVLCKAINVSTNADATLKVVIIYAGIDGTNEILNISDFDPADYAVY